jgi:hypothetical protein
MGRVCVANIVILAQGCAIGSGLADFEPEKKTPAPFMETGVITTTAGLPQCEPPLTMTGFLASLNVSWRAAAQSEALQFQH